MEFANFEGGPAWLSSDVVDEAGVESPRPFHPRKPHTKSRAGCFTCKRRKVKCSEHRPHCTSCIARRLPCEYPKRTQPTLVDSRRARLLPAIPSPVVHSTFSMLDLRLFHHYMQAAYPRLPVGNDHVWVEKVPLLAYQYPFLMHAILALSASSLASVQGGDLVSVALRHRMDAVCGLKQHVCKQGASSSQADALLAAFYALGLQATHLEDGLTDFLTMIRGCHLATKHILCNKLDTVFSFVDDKVLRDEMMPLHGAIPTCPHEIVDWGSASLDSLRSSCTHKVESLTLELLADVALHLKSSTLSVYSSFRKLFDSIADFSSAEFLYFTEATRDIMLILKSYFVALHLIAAPVILRQDSTMRRTLNINYCLQWLQNIYLSVKPTLRTHMDWPMSMMSLFLLESPPSVNMVSL